MDRLKIYARREKNSLNENQFESLTTAKNKCYPIDDEDVNGIQQNHLQLAKLSTTEGVGEKVRQTFPCVKVIFIRKTPMDQLKIYVRREKIV